MRPATSLLLCVLAISVLAVASKKESGTEKVKPYKTLLWKILRFITKTIVTKARLERLELKKEKDL